jgi:hypothetical protein
MLFIRHLVALTAAIILCSAISAPADARGGGGGGRSGGHMRMATHSPMTPPHTPASLASPAAGMPGGGSTKSSPPSTSQAISDGAAAAAAATQVTPSTTAALPPSAIGTPAPQATAIAPLSQPPAQVLESSGGPARTDTVAPSSTSASSPSPSEAAPSTPGGGSDTLQGCMGFWDKGTHMTKTEWRAACTRTLNRLDLISRVPGT